MSGTALASKNMQKCQKTASQKTSVQISLQFGTTQDEAYIIEGELATNPVNKFIVLKLLCSTISQELHVTVGDRSHQTSHDLPC